MTTGTLKTQGSELFLIDTLTSSAAALVKLACPTGIQGLGGAADQLDDSCLDNTTDRTFKRGLGNPGQVTVPFNFIPSNVSHQLLFDLKDDGSVIDWLICFSDGTTDPTLNSSEAFDPPANRTSIYFQGYVADVTIDIATNEIVRGTLLIQRSGPVVPYWNGPTPA